MPMSGIIDHINFYSLLSFSRMFIKQPGKMCLKCHLLGQWAVFCLISLVFSLFAVHNNNISFWNKDWVCFLAAPFKD